VPVLLRHFSPPLHSNAAFRFLQGSLNSLYWRVKCGIHSWKNSYVPGIRGDIPRSRHLITHSVCQVQQKGVVRCLDEQPPEEWHRRSGCCRVSGGRKRTALRHQRRTLYIFSCRPRGALHGMISHGVEGCEEVWSTASVPKQRRKGVKSKVHSDPDPDLTLAAREPHPRNPSVYVLIYSYYSYGRKSRAPRFAD